jgi:hypothetical protein
VLSTRTLHRLLIHLINPDKALPTPEQLYINVPSGSGGALEIGVKTDVRTRFNFIGKEGTPFADQIFSAVDLGGNYVGSKNVAGFTYNQNDYTLEIDNNYVSKSGSIAMMLPQEYDEAFSGSENSWVVGRIG